MSNDHALVQDIYDAALSPDRLPDVLQEMCDRIGAYGAMVFDCTMQNGTRQVGLRHLSRVYDADFVQAYVDEYNAAEVADQDRLADLSSTGDDINLIHDKRLYTNTVLPGPNVDAMRRRGVSDRFGALLSKESWNTDRFAFQFAIGSPLPDPETVSHAEQTLSHLAKSLSMGRNMVQMQALNHALTGYLDGLPIGVAVVGAQGHLHFANTEMMRVAQDNAALTITPAKQFRFDDADAKAALMRLMTDEQAHGTCGARPRHEAVFVKNMDDNGLFIEICPLSKHPELEGFGNGTRLITVLDSTVAHAVNADVVARFFPLSASEIAVLDMISQGHSNSEIAEMRDRSVETVNSQLKSLLRKTNARNRTELVRVAVGLSAVSPSDD